LTLAFNDLEPPASSRSWFLSVVGTPIPGAAGAGAGRATEGEAQGLPVAFALHQSTPNPTRGTATIRFDLATPSRIQLEIFDSQGRRMRRFDASHSAGRFSIEWDLRNASGSRVAPGIYAYRLTAGSHRAGNKMVVLP
jgi:hypothetical protein